MAEYPARPKQASKASRSKALATYQRNWRLIRNWRLMSAREGQAGDPLGVVHAGVSRHDHPRGISVVEGQVRAVDPQREQRVRVQDLPGRQDTLPEGAELFQRLHQHVAR